MASAAERPILFLDVDGPLIPFGASYRSSTSVDQGNPLLDRLDPGIGSRLLALDCPLVWATTWMGEPAQGSWTPISRRSAPGSL
ncbi:hypothetical protein GCM10010260_64220 [Streptomyces filipinensis]|uniref:Uncharacterized protein n=1 Tax=Streptomyces filipinensis TaxID=66887 RepID=A0A918IGY6_9ACTN|nr:hypothetical protein GCM10010260_64220 [Streptomyces filipinensis]